MCQPNPKAEKNNTMDTTVYAVAGLVNSLAYETRDTTPVIPEPEFQPFNLAQLVFTRKKTEETQSDLRGNVSDVLPA
jgi:hypothetical protein